MHLLAFVRRLIVLRKEHPVFRRHPWLQGRLAAGAPDVAWLRPDGREMQLGDWRWPEARALGVFRNGAAIPGHDRHGNPIMDVSFCLLLNAHVETVRFSLLPIVWAPGWRLVLDTQSPEAAAENDRKDVHGPLGVCGRSLLLLQSIAMKDVQVAE